MKKIVITLMAASLLSAFAVGLFLYSGLLDVRATAQHSKLTKWLMTSTMHASVERQGKRIDVPDLSDKALVLEGISDFEAMCVACHGAPDKKPGPIGQGLNPPAPNLQKSAQHHTAGELFWVIKHGIKMTGMPAWGVSHEDESLWPVVALLMALPDLNAESYAALRKQAEGMGHHAESNGKENHVHDSMQMEPATEHSEHTHEHDHYEH